MKQAKPEWFWHLTLNAGYTRKSYRSEVEDSALVTSSSAKPVPDAPECAAD